MPNRGPWKRQGREIVAVLDRIEHKTIGLGSVEAMNPHTLDLGSNLWEVVANVHSPLEGGEWVAVNGSTGRAVDEFVKRIALTPVRQFGPSLR